MIEAFHVGDSEISYMRYLEPYVLSESVEFCRQVVERDACAINLSLPLLLDLRQVTISRFSNRQLVDHFSDLTLYSQYFQNNPIAYLVRDIQDHGMMRMFAAYAEYNGHRIEDNSHVTQKPEEAIQWILNRSKSQNGLANAELRLLIDNAALTMV